MTGPHPNANESYFRQCKHCGQAIHMRQMPAGQWVAFDDAERVHDCQNLSAYNDMYLESTRTLAIPNAPSPMPPATGELATTTRLPAVPHLAASTQTTAPTAAVLPPTRSGTSRIPWLVGLTLLVLGLGWLTSSRIALRPVNVALGQPTPVVRGNALADSPAEAPTTQPSPSSTAVATSEPENIIALKTFEFIFVRSGPDLAYPDVARVYEPNTSFEPQGQSADGEWIFGVAAGDIQGWVLREFVVSDSLDELPVQENVQPSGVTAHIDLKEFEFVYVQQGPGEDFDEASRVDDPSIPFEALARSTDGAWIFVHLQDGTPGWILREFVVSDASVDLLPSYESRTIGIP
ncbi:MAG: hypothetical protein H0T73_01045 [Ardenticatenales bacterium]|nr:hypothetical protein [Ardenticatenales bacterium]